MNGHPFQNEVANEGYRVAKTPEQLHAHAQFRSNTSRKAYGVKNGASSFGVESTPSLSPAADPLPRRIDAPDLPFRRDELLDVVVETGKDADEDEDEDEDDDACDFRLAATTAARLCGGTNDVGMWLHAGSLESTEKW